MSWSTIRAASLRTTPKRETGSLGIFMYDDSMLIKTRPEEAEPREIGEYVDRVATPFQAASQFHDLPLGAARSEMINDQQVPSSCVREPCLKRK